MDLSQCEKFKRKSRVWQRTSDRPAWCSQLLPLLLRKRDSLLIGAADWPHHQHVLGGYSKRRPSHHRHYLVPSLVGRMMWHGLKVEVVKPRALTLPSVPRHEARI